MYVDSVFCQASSFPTRKVLLMHCQESRALLLLHPSLQLHLGFPCWLFHAQSFVAVWVFSTVTGKETSGIKCSP